MAVAMDRTGSGHDGLLKAIVARALPSQGAVQGAAFGASELLELTRAIAAMQVRVLYFGTCNCTHHEVWKAAVVVGIGIAGIILVWVMIDLWMDWIATQQHAESRVKILLM